MCEIDVNDASIAWVLNTFVSRYSCSVVFTVETVYEFRLFFQFVHKNMYNICAINRLIT